MTRALVVKERPILFSGPMVRAIRDGRKTQTRRVVKPQPTAGPNGTLVDLGAGSWGLLDGCLSGEWRCPYGIVGDRLWVRETWAPVRDHEAIYREWPMFDSTTQFDWPWHPSIHMPRWASRITLELTVVRVERVQDITNEDAIAEGCLGGPHVFGYSEQNTAEPYEEYAILWDSLNEKRGYSWNSNPWLWCLTFSLVSPDPEG